MASHFDRHYCGNGSIMKDLSSAGSGAETAAGRTLQPAKGTFPSRHIPDRWLKAPEESCLCLRGDENVPEILDRKYLQEKRMYLYNSKFKGPTQMPSRMPDMPATCKMLLWPSCQTACLLHSQHCYEVLRSETR